MRLAFAGGGSGGHIYPALAVAQRALSRGVDPDRLLFLVTSGGLEETIVHRHGMSTREVHAAKLVRGAVLSALWNAFRGFLDARRALTAFGADAVFGTGGYVALPAVLAARSLGIRSLVFEPNTVPGRANRLLARIVDAVLVSFPQTAPLLGRPGRCREVGTPIRFSFDRSRVRRGPGMTLLVVGGSQGAQALNMAVAHLYPRLLAIDGLSIVHVTGTRDHAAVRALVPAGTDRITLHDYMEAMDELYYRADFAVCRSGAITVSELAEFGIPAIFVPHEPSVGDHQFENARTLASLGAAEILRQSSLTQESLLALIVSFTQGDALAARRRALEAARRPGAADRVLDLIDQLVRTGQLADE